MKKSMTRKDTAARKEALATELRAAAAAGSNRPNQVMVSVRALASKYDLATNTVSLEFQKLADEGVLYTVPRVGTFLGRPKAARDNIFVAIFPYADTENSQFVAIRSGFEERIARLGGTSMVLDFDMVEQYRNRDGAVRPAGIFEFHFDSQPAVWCISGTPHVEFGKISPDCPESDMVNFDNVGGGRVAAQHLIDLGYEKIAFLGIHADEGDPGFFVWSKEREQAWFESMTQAELSTDGLAFHPNETPAVRPIFTTVKARESAEKLLDTPGITAVIAANAIAAEALIQLLRERDQPMDTWPALVGFDSQMAFPKDDPMRFVTALRLPWEEIGREAATLLWERSQGHLTGAPQQRLVSMSLIPRLSCRQEWHRAPVASPRQKTVSAVF